MLTLEEKLEAAFTALRTIASCSRCENCVALAIFTLSLGEEPVEEFVQTANT